MVKNWRRDWDRFVLFCKQQQYFHKRFDLYPREEIFVAEAADILECRPSFIRRAIKKNKLHPRRIGKYFLINKRDLWIFFCLTGKWNGKKIILSA